MRFFITIVVLATIALFSYLVLFTTKTAIQNLPDNSPTEKAIALKLSRDERGWKNLQFDLVDPSQAPLPLRDTVEAGYRLVLHTHELLPNYAENSLNCSNCHFGGGITLGGVWGGISLAGVAAQYPRFNPAAGKIEDLAERVNNCFEKSMSGKPLPLDSKEMLAIITYLHWISARFPIYGPAPWLGMKPLKSSHVANADAGKKNYQLFCADCHGKDGEGSNDSPLHPGTTIPPIWGPHSFNSKAGMNRPETFASFIYHNMPYDEPHLTPDEALDIAAFVTEQPRP
jgi:thiosulfate dehydrogenase